MNLSAPAQAAGGWRPLLRMLRPYGYWVIAMGVYYLAMVLFVENVVGFDADRSASIARGLAVAIGVMGIAIMAVCGVGWRRKRG